MHIYVNARGAWQSHVDANRIRYSLQVDPQKFAADQLKLPA